MNFRNSTTIDASPDTLWAILATDYNNIGDWTTTVLHSEQDPDLPEGEGRVIQVPRLGEVHEPIRHFDAEKRTFTFEVIADGESLRFDCRTSLYNGVSAAWISPVWSLLGVFWGPLAPCFFCPVDRQSFGWRCSSASS